MVSSNEASEEKNRPSPDVELEVDVLAASGLTAAEPVAGDPSQRSITVIVADAALRAYVCRCIERSCDVDAALAEYEDGVAALHAVRQWGTHLVICEADLPRLGGLQLIEALRRDPELASVPVLLLAVRSLPYTERRRVQQIDHVALVDQPLSAQRLCKLVRRYLDG